jgi:hypothetical protein
MALPGETLALKIGGKQTKGLSPSITLLKNAFEAV